MIAGSFAWLGWKPVAWISATSPGLVCVSQSSLVARTALSDSFEASMAAKGKPDEAEDEPKNAAPIETALTTIRSAARREPWLPQLGRRQIRLTEQAMHDAVVDAAWLQDR